MKYQTKSGFTPDNMFMSAMKYVDRRELLSRRMNQQKLQCPKCETRQVQLVGYIDIAPAQWKCRHCKYKFEWEGEG